MKHAIIIGASSGIGYQLAVNLVAHGYVVGVTARRYPLLATLSEQYPGKIIPMELDVREVHQIAIKLDELKAQLQGLDLLIISAGVGELNPLLDFQVEKIMIDTNVSGFTAVADWAFQQFSSNGHGTLAAITSIAGLRGNGQSPAYGATKAYQINYLEGLRQKAAKQFKGVKVIDIRPGFVDTKMAKGDKVFWVSNVEKASRQILSDILNNRPVTYVSRRWRLISWLLKLLPGTLHRRL